MKRKQQAAQPSRPLLFVLIHPSSLIPHPFNHPSSLTLSLPSPLFSLHGGGEKLFDVEDGDDVASALNDAAQDVCACAQRERLDFVGEDFVDAQGAINGQGKLLVTTQRDDEGRSRRSVCREIAEER